MSKSKPSMEPKETKVISLKVIPGGAGSAKGAPHSGADAGATLAAPELSLDELIGSFEAGAAEVERDIDQIRQEAAKAAQTAAERTAKAEEHARLSALGTEFMSLAQEMTSIAQLLEETTGFLNSHQEDLTGLTRELTKLNTFLEGAMVRIAELKARQAEAGLEPSPKMVKLEETVAKAKESKVGLDASVALKTEKVSRGKATLGEQTAKKAGLEGQLADPKFNEIRPIFAEYQAAFEHMRSVEAAIRVLEGQIEKVGQRVDGGTVLTPKVLEARYDDVATLAGKGCAIKAAVRKEAGKKQHSLEPDRELIAKFGLLIGEDRANQMKGVIERLIDRVAQISGKLTDAAKLYAARQDQAGSLEQERRGGRGSKEGRGVRRPTLVSSGGRGGREQDEEKPAKPVALARPEAPSARVQKAIRDEMEAMAKDPESKISLVGRLQATLKTQPGLLDQALKYLRELEAFNKAQAAAAAKKVKPAVAAKTGAGSKDKPVLAAKVTRPVAAAKAAPVGAGEAAPEATRLSGATKRLVDKVRSPEAAQGIKTLSEAFLRANTSGVNTVVKLTDPETGSVTEVKKEVLAAAPGVFRVYADGLNVGVVRLKLDEQGKPTKEVLGLATLKGHEAALRSIVAGADLGDESAFKDMHAVTAKKGGLDKFLAAQAKKKEKK